MPNTEPLVMPDKLRIRLAGEVIREMSQEEYLMVDGLWVRFVPQEGS
jgi:hypothetical protein